MEPFCRICRSQTNPGAALLAISRRPYGYDLRESQVSPYYTDRYLDMKEEMLKVVKGS